MAELRWVLLGLGVLVVAGVYLWGRGSFARKASSRRRAEPHISAPPEFAEDDRLVASSSEVTEVGAGAIDERARPDLSRTVAEPKAPHERPTPPQEHANPPDKIVTVRFIPRAAEIGGEEAVQALREAGLEHGRYGIFHLHDEDGSGEAQFSVASLTEPGSFDLTQLDVNPIAGMSFFMVLPGTGDPVARFDAMVQTARMLAIELDAELFDDRGSSWSIQRERYVREEIIRYRHQLMQTEVAGNAGA